MGRFYSISVTPAATGANQAAPSPVRLWTSVNTTGGGDDPGALDVEFDFFEYVYAVPMGDSTITIKGVSLQDLQGAQDFAGMDVSVSGGMSAGLPLADPTQSGVLLKGNVFQSFGNWVGADMALNFVVRPSIYSYASPGNIVLNWTAGTTLKAALSNALTVAYPGISLVLNIGQYVNSYDVVSYYSTLRQLATAVKSITKVGGMQGVDIAYLNNATILASDGSIPGNASQIKFTDFIGQPTWVDINVMQFTTVMRADIQTGGLVQMPQGLQNAPGIVTTTAASFPSQLKYKTSFQGQFIVQSVRHVGAFRDPDGKAWVSIFQCVPLSSAGPSGGV
jgi:hypothetical protein